jgi:hypothetical protein
MWKVRCECRVNVREMQMDNWVIWILGYWGSLISWHLRKTLRVCIICCPPGRKPSLVYLCGVPFRAGYPLQVLALKASLRAFRCYPSRKGRRFSMCARPFRPLKGYQGKQPMQIQLHGPKCILYWLWFPTRPRL